MTAAQTDFFAEIEPKPLQASFRSLCKLRSDRPRLLAKLITLRWPGD